MPKSKVEEQVAALEELRKSPDSAAAAEALRKALAHRNNFVVSKAARVAAELGLRSLVPDLLAAFDRFFAEAVKSDPQCWAKNEIAKALGELGHHESATYLRGLRHIQMEPVWGGQADTAGPLRCHCALALVDCRDLPDFALLSHLIEILVDDDQTVRAEGARAIGRMNRPEAALLLRLRALTGDPEPEVLGACFSALLSIQGREGLPFVARFLDGRGDSREEAALAIGAMRGRDAFELLKTRLDGSRDAAFREVLLNAIALTREEDAMEFLVRLAEAEGLDSVPARKALASFRLTPELEARLGKRSGSGPRV